MHRIRHLRARSIQLVEFPNVYCVAFAERVQAQIVIHDDRRLESQRNSVAGIAVAADVAVVVVDVAVVGDVDVVGVVNFVDNDLAAHTILVRHPLLPSFSFHFPITDNSKMVRVQIELISFVSRTNYDTKLRAVDSMVQWPMQSLAMYSQQSANRIYPLLLAAVDM